MSETTRDVVVRIQAKLVGGDPFQKLAAQAQATEDRIRKAIQTGPKMFDGGKAPDIMNRLNANVAAGQQQLFQRLDAVQKKLRAATTLDNVVQEKAIDFFGISKADRQVGKLANTVGDNLRKLERQALTVKIDGNPAPLLGTLRRVENDVKRVNQSVRTLAGASQAGFQRVGAGMEGMARGLMLLQGEDKTFDQVILKMIKFQAAMDVFRGGKELFTGLVGGVGNLVKMTSAMGTAGKLAAGLATTTASVNLALAGQAVAETVVAEATVRTIPPALEAAAANRELARSHLEAAEAAGAHALAESTGGRGRITAVGLGLGRAAIGGAIGYGVGSAYGHEYIGAGIGAAAGAALPLAGKALTGVGAAVGLGGAAALGTAGVIAGAIVYAFKHQDVHQAIASFWDVFFGEGHRRDQMFAKQTDFLKQKKEWTDITLGTEKPFRDKLRGLGELVPLAAADLAGERRGNERFREDRARQQQQDQFQEMMRLSVRPNADAGDILGGQATQARQRAEQRVRDLERQLREGGQAGAVPALPLPQRPLLDLARAGGRGQHDPILDLLEKSRTERPPDPEDLQRDLRRARQSLQEAQARERQPGANVGVVGQAQAVLGQVLNGSPGTAASEQNLAVATVQNNLALKDRQRIVGEIAATEETIAAKIGRGDLTLIVSVTQRAHLEKELADATDRTLQTKQQLIQAEREHSTAERDRLDQWRQWAQDAEKFYREQARQEQDKTNSMKEQLGLMDPLKRLAVLDVAKKLAAGKTLSRQEVEVAQGATVLADPLQAMARRNAEQDPVVAEILRVVGRDRKEKEADAAAKQFADIKVQLEQKVEAQINIGEASLTDLIAKELTPVILQAIQQTQVLMRQELNRALQEAEANRRVGAQGH